MSKQELDKLIAEEQAKNPTVEQVGELLYPDDQNDDWEAQEEAQADWEWTIENTMGVNSVCNLIVPKSPFNR